MAEKHRAVCADSLERESCNWHRQKFSDVLRVVDGVYDSSITLGKSLCVMDNSDRPLAIVDTTLRRVHAQLDKVTVPQYWSWLLSIEEPGVIIYYW